MACIEYPLCKYAHYENEALVCQTGALCPYQRYCSTLLKVIHTSAYKNCKEVKNMSNAKNVATSNPKKVEKVEVVQKDIIEKSEMCKVTYVDDLIYINFKGFGLIAKNEKGYTDPEIKVIYYGEIGEPNFKFSI